nr:hypothetical protein [Paenibacillus anseongense]
MDKLFQNTGHEETSPNNGRMDEKTDSHDLLEAMETGQNKIQYVANTRSTGPERMGICKHKKELLENLQKPNPR